jgi:superfamily II DNA or RNA helicase
MKKNNLRNYQILGIEKLRNVLLAGKKRIILYSPTGSGKTVIAEEIINKTLEKGKKVAFIANRVDLVSQTSRRLAKIPHGIIQGQNTFNVHENLVICSIQTVARRGLPYVDLIIIDEAHACAGSKDYKKLIASYNNLPIIGLTATPFSKGLGAINSEIGGEVFEEMVICATIQDLIKEGHLVDCEIYAPSEPDLTNVKTFTNSFGELDYNEVDLAKAVDKQELIGDIVKHWIKLANNKPTVVFATNIVHSKHICEQFILSGITAEHIDCYTEEEERKSIMKRVLNGETKIICNVGILCEGWDFPACEVMILARPTKSLIRWIQMAGRVLRPFEGKEVGLILDHSGSTKHLGYPTDDLPLNLCDGSARSSEARIKKEEAKPKECPKCKFMKPPKVSICPKCSFKPEPINEIVHSDGDLIKLEKYTKEQKQDFYSELLYIQKDKGYKPTWASVLFKKKFGDWPDKFNNTTKFASLETNKYVQSQFIRYAKGKSKSTEFGRNKLKEIKELILNG